MAGRVPFGRKRIDFGQGAIAIEGLAELEKKLRTMPDKMQRRIMQAAMRAGVRPLVLAARNAVPQKTGNMRKMIRGSVKRLPKQQAIRGRVVVRPTKKQREKGWSADYSRHVIRGTRPHVIPKKGTGVFFGGKWYGQVKHPGSKPQPFLDDVYQREQEAAIAAYRAKFFSKFELEASKL